MRLIYRILDYLKRKQRQRYIPLNHITISSSTIQENIAHLYSLMQHTSSSTSILIPVLKSNAYGHGLRQLCNIIMTINPKICPLLAVDSYPEYKLLHRYTDRDILIMGEQNPQNYHLYDRHRTHLAIGTLTNLRILLESGKCFHIQMFLNTSMNREGFQRQTLYQALELRQNIDHNCILTGIMSHCAGADIADDTSIIDQLTLFKKMYQTIIDILPRNQTQKIHYIHLGNTAGTAKLSDPILTACRSGKGIYGYSPLSDNDPYSHQLVPLRPALSAYSTIIAIQHLQPGDSVGYGHDRVADSPCTVATIPRGYHEGLPRRYTQQGYILYRDQLCPLVGRISMNMCTFLAPDDVQLHDPVQLITTDTTQPLTIDALAQQSGTIDYTVLTGLHPSVRRVVIDA